jgi:hypothetical protein
MQVIPILPVASQTFKAVLAKQNCDISIYQKTTGLYFDLSVSGKSIVHGMICRDRVKLIRYAYLGFIGDLIFMDTFAKLDPTYDGLGSRFILLYLESSDM